MRACSIRRMNHCNPYDRRSTSTWCSKLSWTKGITTQGGRGAQGSGRSKCEPTLPTRASHSLSSSVMAPWKTSPIASASRTSCPLKAARPCLKPTRSGNPRSALDDPLPFLLSPFSFPSSFLHLNDISFLPSISSCPLFPSFILKKVIIKKKKKGFHSNPFTVSSFLRLPFLKSNPPSSSQVPFSDT